MNTRQTEQLDAGEHWVEKLGDGSAVLIRPLREEDRERDRHFLCTIIYESRRLRLIAGLGGGLPRLGTQSILTDEHQCMAYVALAHVNGTLHEIGVSRYAGIPDSQRCECAVAVSEDWQRKGLGRRLMQHLIAAARRNGFQCIVSRDLANNYAMHRLTKSLGFTSHYVDGDVSEILHELDLRS